MPLGLGIGAGIGLLKFLALDQPNAAAQNEVNAAVARYSPWTGMKASTTRPDVNAMGSILGGAGAGAALSQGLKNAAAHAVDVPGYTGPDLQAPGFLQSDAAQNPWGNALTKPIIPGSTSPMGSFNPQQYYGLT